MALERNSLKEIILLLWIVMVAGSALTLARENASPAARRLSDYTNANGKAPTGKDDGLDDTTALRKALSDGPGVVYVEPGFYRWGDVQIPSGVAVVGAGAATIVRSSGPKEIFVQKGAHDWAIRDLVLDGEAPGDWRQREDKGRSGIATSGCWRYEIVGVTLTNFDGAGLQLTGASQWHIGGNLDRITAMGNYAGIRFDFRGEYMNASELTCYHNVVGAIIHAGNTKITASNFNDNVDGLVIDDKENGSHGAISNCLVNHNARYALMAKNAANGMVIDGCCFFYGAIRLEGCAGINITSGIIACAVSTKGTGANRIAGNYIITETGSTTPPWPFELSNSTIVEGNFTKQGLWDKNSNQVSIKSPAR